MSEVTEYWVNIKDYNNIYQVSNLGRVKSVTHYCKGRKGSGKQTGRILKQHISKKGYLRVSLSLNKKRKQYFSHRLVAMHFIENPLNKPQVNHKNGIKTDNRVENLEWVTNSENQIHAVKNNLIKHNTGDRHHMSKLTNSQVKDARFLHFLGDSCKNLALKYKVSNVAMNNILRNKTYKNID